MKKEKTQRGFTFLSFEDTKAEEITIQESSSATESCIWIGAKSLKLQKFSPEKGWYEISAGENVIGNEKMHINQDQAFELAKVLLDFYHNGHL